ncbi:hypothetical protein L3Q67_43500 [Saccharothrix sp. AJ9571]|nr:hypothetical protein L3Q67_43500 [Saccharothrix sp. AJ9571]
MRLAFPAGARRIALTDADRAIRELTEVLGGLRHDPAGVLEPMATEVVETAIEGGAFELALVAPEDADPAVLTLVAMEVPDGWDATGAEALRDAMEDVGGPDVRETRALDTELGPAVLTQRVPGVEQGRTGERLTLQLQGFLVEPGTGRMLLLTLAGPSARGWDVHQRWFTELVASAGQR